MCSRWTISIALMVLPMLSLANDGGLVSGGSPKLLDGHPTVAMKSEVVNIRVFANKMKVECTFIFHNSGSATSVRMGFPDFAEGAMDPGEDEAFDPSKPGAQAGMTWFSSWVNGRSVPTKLEKGQQEGEYWRTKTVSFAAHRDTLVKDVYEQPISGGVTAQGAGSIAAIRYILHTGSSWHGTIGRSTVNLILEDRSIPTPIKWKPIASAERAYGLNWAKESQQRVYYTGPSRPRTKGRTISWTRSNWRPAKKDDISLYYRFHKITS